MDFWPSGAIITVIQFGGLDFCSSSKDHYGDLQNFYYESKNWNIVNKTTSDFRIIEKTGNN
jgi:hypothetical protein